MRPQDIVILLKIIALGDQSWQNKDLAAALFISPSEISESLHRSAMAGLINADKKRVHRQTLQEFIEYGLHVVFPAIPGGMVNGLFTAHSHPFMRKHFSSSEPLVWPDIAGKDRGLSLSPLYKDVPKAAQQDATLYKMLALLDVVRVGKVRELKVALGELNNLLKA